MNQIESITSILRAMDASDVLKIWNEYAIDKQLFDEVVYENDEEFFNLNYDGDILGAVRAVCYGDYTYMHPYVRIGMLGNLKSYETASDAVFDIVNYEELAKYVIETDTDDFNAVWIDDLMADFCIYADDHGLYFNEETDFGDFNFVTDDWDDYLTEYREKLS